MSLIYRVDNPTSYKGCWYNKDGSFNNSILELTGAKSRDLPMGYDPSIAGGWISATDELNKIPDWFSFKDLLELQKGGYGLYEYEVTDYRQVPGHVVFTRASVIKERKLSIEFVREAEQRR